MFDAERFRGSSPSPVHEEMDKGLLGLTSLRDHENARHAELWSTATSHAQIRPVLALIDETVDFMLTVASSPPGRDADGTAISAIAARIFNTTAGALREALNGYPQTSFLLQRGLIEIHTLLDVFSHDPSLIARWREVTNEERLREFSPRRLRTILEERDGEEHDAIRRDEYRLFSEHAAHLTYPALRLLALADGSIAVGPTNDFKQIGNCLYELGRQVLKVASAETRLMMMLYVRERVGVSRDWQSRVDQIQESGIRIYGS